MTMVGACSCQIIRQKSTMVVSTGPVRREGGREEEVVEGREDGRG